MDADWLTLSSLEHHTYCPWQARLLLGGVWADNHLTVQGTSAHERVDSSVVDRRRGVRIHHPVAVMSERRRVHGVADTVEETRGGAFTPVEHKWGRGAGDLRPSIVQAVAQALCLEEMLCVRVSQAAIFIVSERRKEVVEVDDWRAETEDAVVKARLDLLGMPLGPPVYVARRCRGCSIQQACQPIRDEP